MEKDKFSISIMVWEGIIGGRKTPEIVCPNRLNAESYVAMLEEHRIVEFLQQSGDNALFQQDGARCHTAALPKRWFASKNVKLLEGWPANSPDLSPIEQIWGISKRFIIQRYGTRKPLTREQLENGVFEAYESIKPSTIAILTLSMKFRVHLASRGMGALSETQSKNVVSAQRSSSSR